MKMHLGRGRHGSVGQGHDCGRANQRRQAKIRLLQALGQGFQNAMLRKLYQAILQVLARGFVFGDGGALGLAEDRQSALPVTKLNRKTLLLQILN